MIAVTNTNITNFRKNLFEYVDQAVTYGDVVNIATKHGNAVMRPTTTPWLRRCISPPYRA